MAQFPYLVDFRGTTPNVLLKNELERAGIDWLFWDDNIKRIFHDFKDGPNPQSYRDSLAVIVLVERFKVALVEAPTPFNQLIFPGTSIIGRLPSWTFYRLEKSWWAKADSGVGVIETRPRTRTTETADKNQEKTIRSSCSFNTEEKLKAFADRIRAQQP
jgi:hypothetical protein